jgi:hypothetical protein
MNFSDLALLPWAITVVTAAAMPAFALARYIRRGIGKSRNERVKCAHCAGHFDSLVEAHLFEGRYLCGNCSTEFRRHLSRIYTGFAGLGVAALMFGVGGMLVDVTLFDSGAWWTWNRIILVCIPPIAVTFTARNSLRRLQRQNAEEQLVAAAMVTTNALQIGR